jgi:TPR repeat protein
VALQVYRIDRSLSDPRSLNAFLLFYILLHWLNRQKSRPHCNLFRLQILSKLVRLSALNVIRLRRTHMKSRYILFSFFLFATSSVNAQGMFSPESFYSQAKQYEQTDRAKAISLYTESAKGGYLPAQLLLGGIYQFGIRNVAEQDCEKSSYWYMKAVEQNSISAIADLAAVYNDQEGKCFSLEKSVGLYMEAARKGHGQAQQSLALLYLNGRGVKRHLISAYAWLSASMKNGTYRSSLPLRDRVEKEMTAAEISEAKVLSNTLSFSNIE